MYDVGIGRDRDRDRDRDHRLMNSRVFQKKPGFVLQVKKVI